MNAAIQLDTTQTRRPLKVLQSVDRINDQTNPYLIQLLRALPEEVDVRFFSMRRALLSRYDVFHVHWPEYLFRHRHPLGALLKQLCAALLLFKLAVTRTAVVRTLHNLSPHEDKGWRERTLLKWLDALTTRWIRLNTTTPLQAPATDTVLHGHYRDWYASKPKSKMVRGRLLHFGLIRPYKGVETLVEVMPKIQSEGVSLRIVGSPASEAMRQLVLEAGERDPRISSLLQYVDDDTLAQEVSAAELIVLPYRQMHNSGTLLLALSLGRPVLAPWNGANQAIADEVGADWVQLYRGEFDADAIDTALAAVRKGDRPAAPDLSQREWAAAGEAHYRAYRAALGLPVEAA
jgi:beta-1,4-mannosyltransferase